MNRVRIEGEIGDGLLPDLLQLLGSRAEATGYLELSSDQLTGKAWLHHGQMVDAEWHGKAGEEAVLAMLRLTHGRFQFVEAQEHAVRTILRDTTSILLDCMRAMDEGETEPGGPLAPAPGPVSPISPIAPAAPAPPTRPPSRLPSPVAGVSAKPASPKESAPSSPAPHPENSVRPVTSRSQRPSLVLRGPEPVAAVPPRPARRLRLPALSFPRLRVPRLRQSRVWRFAAGFVLAGLVLVLAHFSLPVRLRRGERVAQTSIAASRAEPRLYTESGPAGDSSPSSSLSAPHMWPYVSLSGLIATSPHEGSAVVNGQIVGIGDEVDGVTVRHIGGAGITLEFQGTRRFINMPPPMPF